MKTLVKHLKNERIGEIIKENPKTFLVKTLKVGYETIYEKVLWKKEDVSSYTEPVKEKSFYDKMRERNMEDAKNLPTTPKEASQTILLLKMAIIDRVEKIEKRDHKEDNIFTFREKSTDRFGFTENYVNILMQMAYDEGHKNATETLTKRYNSSTQLMKDALDKIKDALDDANWIEECNCNY
jgi:hypothetical protein